MAKTILSIPTSYSDSYATVGQSSNAARKANREPGPLSYQGYVPFPCSNTSCSSSLFPSIMSTKGYTCSGVSSELQRQEERSRFSILTESAVGLAPFSAVFIWERFDTVNPGQYEKTLMVSLSALKPTDKWAVTCARVNAYSGREGGSHHSPYSPRPCWSYTASQTRHSGCT